MKSFSFAGIAALCAMLHFGSVHNWSTSQLLASGGDPTYGDPCDADEGFQTCKNNGNKICTAKEVASVEDTAQTHYLVKSQPTVTSFCDDPTNCIATTYAPYAAGCDRKKKTGIITVE